ncbi:MAG: hypothetical protein MJY53_03765 [Bacteroidales bacterium]|nr:hypothetical protein [Bacteroidales bacterium]
MVTFIGKYNSKVDDKGRLVFPSPFKGAVPPGSDMRFVIKKSLYDDCLEMWSYEEWEREAEKIREGLDFFNPQHVQFWREYMRDCDVVEPDAKLGRISISRYLLDAISVTKDVVFFGVNFKIEIWAAEKFGDSKVSKEDYVAIAQSLSRK